MANRWQADRRPCLMGVPVPVPEAKLAIRALAPRVARGSLPVVRRRDLGLAVVGVMAAPATAELENPAKAGTAPAQLEALAPLLEAPPEAPAPAMAGQRVDTEAQVPAKLGLAPVRVRVRAVVTTLVAM
jgi:hypothetical protein